MSNGFVENKEDLFELMDKFEKSEMSELTLKFEDQLIKMKKGVEQHIVNPMAPVAQHVQAPAHSVPANAADGSSAAAADGEIISAPLVGTFYRQPAPDAPPFAEVGSTIKAGETLCILEAMKIMNELEAEFDCEIMEVLMESGKLAEFGTPLFRVKRI